MLSEKPISNIISLNVCNNVLVESLVKNILLTTYLGLYHCKALLNWFFFFPSGLLTQTPLHLAVYLNQVSVVKALVVNGACLELQDQDGNTPLHVACEHGRFECANEMIRQASPSMLAPVFETQNWKGNAAANYPLINISEKHEKSAAMFYCLEHPKLSCATAFLCNIQCPNRDKTNHKDPVARKLTAIILTNREVCLLRVVTLLVWFNGWLLSGRRRSITALIEHLLNNSPNRSIRRNTFCCLATEVSVNRCILWLKNCWMFLQIHRILSYQFCHTFCHSGFIAFRYDAERNAWNPHTHDKITVILTLTKFIIWVDSLTDMPGC